MLSKKPSISIEEAWSAIETHMEIARAVIRSERRGTRIAAARAVWCWLVYRGTTLSLPQIGRELDKHHTTVLQAIRRVDLNATQRAEAEKLEAWIFQQKAVVAK